MSLEQKVEELNLNLLALVEQLKITATNQERLIEGQVAALAKVEPEKRTRSTKAKEPEEGKEAAAPATTESPAADVTVAAEVTEDDLRKVASGYLCAGLKDAAKPTPEEMPTVTARRDFMTKMLTALGTPKLCGDESTLNAAGRATALFFFNRAAAGLPVDFTANYDFAGPVDQIVGAAADDGFDIG